MAAFNSDAQDRGDRMIIGARAHFCAGHRLPQHEEVHGHSYEVWAYTEQAIDVEMFQELVVTACKTLDHRMLNEFMAEPTMENIARYLAVRINGATRVRILRPVEGLCCEYEIK